MFEILGTDPVKDAAIVKMSHRWLDAMAQLERALNDPKSATKYVKPDAEFEKVFLFLEKLANECERANENGVNITILTSRNIVIGKHNE